MYTRRRRNETMRIYIALIGILQCAISSLAAMDVLIFDSQMQWASWLSNNTGMSIPTSVCFFFTGSVFIALAVSKTIWCDDHSNHPT